MHAGKGSLRAGKEPRSPTGPQGAPRGPGTPRDENLRDLGGSEDFRSPLGAPQCPYLIHQGPWGPPRTGASLASGIEARAGARDRPGQNWGQGEVRGRARSRANPRAPSLETPCGS